MPAMPASSPLIWRSPSMKRAMVTTLPPWVLKNTSARSSRCGVRKTYRPNRSASGRPPKWPTMKPMLSPTTAASTATRKTTAMFIWPAPAKTAAAINMISPGTGTPKSSRNSIPPTPR